MGARGFRPLVTARLIRAVLLLSFACVSHCLEKRPNGSVKRELLDNNKSKLFFHGNERDDIYLRIRRLAAFPIFTPVCKFGEDIIKDDRKLKRLISEAEYVFSGKVSSDNFTRVNGSLIFDVYVKRFFRNVGFLKHSPEIRVSKQLRDDEGTRCKQIVRFRYTGIFIGRSPTVLEGTDVELIVNPVSITLENLERINAAAKGTNKFL